MSSSPGSNITVSFDSPQLDFQDTWSNAQSHVVCNGANCQVTFQFKGTAIYLMGNGVANSPANPTIVVDGQSPLTVDIPTGISEEATFFAQWGLSATENHEIVYSGTIQGAEMTFSRFIYTQAEADDTIANPSPGSSPEAPPPISTISTDSSITPSTSSQGSVVQSTSPSAISKVSSASVRIPSGTISEIGLPSPSDTPGSQISGPSSGPSTVSLAGTRRTSGAALIGGIVSGLIVLFILLLVAARYYRFRQSTGWTIRRGSLQPYMDSDLNARVKEIPLEQNHSPIKLKVRRGFESPTMSAQTPPPTLGAPSIATEEPPPPYIDNHRRHTRRTTRRSSRAPNSVGFWL